ncbi:uncharacterized protein B0H64DRAFT_29588 [Chaetomium fimeti]|uniref:Uncharacterized protein n=1 Tax=Chaetomium fimeti TaxID=1854472 RepID=A0AAE0LXH7_9PEZI|nr:hypothetical protein B0H64DRAFT_29588 [Chaetomium fimeti]
MQFVITLILPVRFPSCQAAIRVPMPTRNRGFAADLLWIPLLIPFSCLIRSRRIGNAASLGPPKEMARTLSTSSEKYGRHPSRRMSRLPDGGRQSDREGGMKTPDTRHITSHLPLVFSGRKDIRWGKKGPCWLALAQPSKPGQRANKPKREPSQNFPVVM